MLGAGTYRYGGWAFTHDGRGKTMLFRGHLFSLGVLLALANVGWSRPAAGQARAETLSKPFQDLPACYALLHGSGRPASDSLYWAPAAVRVQPNGVVERLGDKKRSDRGRSGWMRDSLSDSVRLAFSSGFSGTVFTLTSGRTTGLLIGRATQFWDFGPPFETDGGPVGARRIHCPRGELEIVSAPFGPLLEMTRRWSRASSLGDLQERALAPDDIEVRAWSGYGIGGSDAIVARREGGTWRAWSAEVVGCHISVVASIADTASAETRKGFIAAARKNCHSAIGTPRPGEGSVLFMSDSVEVTALAASSAAIDSAWNAAVSAGMLTLPPSVPRKWWMLDGSTYLLEVRRGNEYRAAAIESLETPEVEADAQIKAVYAALSRIRKP